MKKNPKFIFVTVAIVIIGLFTALYLSNALEKTGLCRPGMKFMAGPFGERFCYTPSGKEGRPCDRQTDCGTGACILMHEDLTTDKGVCSDITYGCIQFIDNNGNINPLICLD